MKTTKLTKRAIEAMRDPIAERVTVQDTDDKYLHLILNPTTKSWRYIRKVKGRMVFITLGHHPDMTPAQARHESRNISAAYTRGEDPQLQKRQAKIITTWADLFSWYIEEYAKSRKKTWAADVKTEARYCKSWQSRDWQTLTRAFVTKWHKTLGSKNGRIAADRALALVRGVFNRSIDEGVIIGNNPASGVKLFFSDPARYARDRFLSADELKRLFKVLDEYADQNMADFFRLCVFTGARRGNVQAMRWKDFDREREIWRIPGMVSKNGEPMSIPLLDEAMLILNRRYDVRRSDEWVFPSRNKNAKTPHLAEPKKAWAAICGAAGIHGVRIHDLRRTLGSWMAINGTSLAIIGRTLGHKSPQATEIYARLSDEPVRKSMGAAVTKMLQAAKGDEVDGGEE